MTVAELSKSCVEATAALMAATQHMRTGVLPTPPPIPPPAPSVLPTSLTMLHRGETAQVAELAVGEVQGEGAAAAEGPQQGGIPPSLE